MIEQKTKVVPLSSKSVSSPSLLNPSVHKATPPAPLILIKTASDDHSLNPSLYPFAKRSSLTSQQRKFFDSADWALRKANAEKVVAQQESTLTKPKCWRPSGNFKTCDATKHCNPFQLNSVCVKSTCGQTYEMKTPWQNGLEQPRSPLAMSLHSWRALFLSGLSEDITEQPSWGASASFLPIPRWSSTWVLLCSASVEELSILRSSPVPSREFHMC